MALIHPLLFLFLAFLSLFLFGLFLGTGRLVQSGKINLANNVNL